jgi:hypothetical protein
MGADRRRVEDQDVQVGITQSRQDWVPASLLGPPIEPTPLAVAFAQTLREILPRRPGAGDPQDRVDEPAVVRRDPAVLAALSGQQLLDPIPIDVRNRMPVDHGRSSVAKTRPANYPFHLPGVHTT